MAQNIDSFKWKNRILLLKDSHINSMKLQEQLKALQSNLEKLHDRDILIFVLTDAAVFDALKSKTKLQSRLIIEEFGLKDFQGLILIGKDGGLKLKESFVVSPSTICNLIDSMPMRRAELKSSEKY
jgi:hypothetical protein